MKFKKLLIIWLVSSTCFSANAAYQDPCENIAGQWQGKITSGYCVWTATATVEKYQTTVRINLHSTSIPNYPECNYKVEGYMSGTCKNAYISLQQGVTGSIFGNTFTLSSPKGATLEMRKM